MLDLLTVTIGLVFYIVSVAICWKAQVWRRVWANPGLKWIALSSTAAWAGRLFTWNDISRLGLNHPVVARLAVTPAAFFGFFLCGIFLWPMLGGALWLGEASLCPVEGKYASRFWESVGEIALLLAVLIAVTLLLKVLFGWHVQALWIPENMHRPAGTLAFAVLIVLLYFLFAVLEELIYRGILLRWLIWKTSGWRYRLGFSLLCSAAIFCLGHGPVITLPQCAQKMVIGVGLGWLSLRRGLWASIVAHYSFNLIINCLL